MSEVLDPSTLSPTPRILTPKTCTLNSHAKYLNHEPLDYAACGIVRGREDAPPRPPCRRHPDIVWLNSHRSTLYPNPTTLHILNSVSERVSPSAEIKR